jgi:pimeloyl-ACP methyl ester carboxylesterase
MKKKLLGVKRNDILFDYDLYRRKVPIPGVAGQYLSVLDLWPEGAERTILFQHGYAGVLESWEYQINYFASHNYRVIAPDLRGHGQSDAPYTRYTMDELVADMYAITQHLKLPEQFTLVAHSFGGSIAVEYANAHPEQLDKLVLIATAGEYPLPRIANWLLKLPLNWLRPLWKYRTRWDAELHVIKNMMANNMRRWQGWSLMRDITTPTLVITGERDNYFPRRVFEDVGKMIPNAEVVDVGSAKHKVQLERHQAVSRAIERFVEGRSALLARGHQRRQSAARARLAQELQSGHAALDTDSQTAVARFPAKRGRLAAPPHRHPFLRLPPDLPRTQRAGQPDEPRLSRAGGAPWRPGDGHFAQHAPDGRLLLRRAAGRGRGGAAQCRGRRHRIIRQVHETQPKVLVTVRSFSQLAQAVKAHTGLDQFVFADLRTAVSHSVYQKLIERFGIADDEEQHKAIARELGQRMFTVRQDAPITPLGHRGQARRSGRHPLHQRHHRPAQRGGPFPPQPGGQHPANPPLGPRSDLRQRGLSDRHAPAAQLRPDHGHERAHRPGGHPGHAARLRHRSGPGAYPRPQSDDVPRHPRHVYGHQPDAQRARVWPLLGQSLHQRRHPLPIEVQEAFEKLTHGRLVEGYGLTEASPVTHANPLYGLRKTGSIGIPCPTPTPKSST